MIYKKLTKETQRAYKSMGNWGIGSTIHDTKQGAVLIMDICYEDQILPFVNERYGSIPIAKVSAVKHIRKLINELGKWKEE